ncbi:MAG: GDP-L-fucose synthase [Bryobacterales bacterium]|nr:GDP-L-fucose synthase [Bryobacterales bacterium]MBV9397770.1 GDP-L-fucose synthase [Bryobacterales bacterium]
MTRLTASSRIYIAGHRGLVGSAIVRELQRRGCERLLTASRAQLDLRDQSAVNRFMAENKPDFVFLAAARVGGILANSTRPADFLYDNLAIQTHVIHAASRNGAQKLVFLGSSCIYPKFAPQPIKEEYLLTGPLEPTNEAYAIAKIAGLKLCGAYREQYGLNAISLMPTNLYGPGDNFDLETSHVLPALIRRLHEAKISGRGEVTLWGTGTPRREFLHVDDMAAAACFALEHYDSAEPLNVGVGEDVSIAELASMVAKITGFSGAVNFDRSKPDGTPRKLLDVSRLTALGWRAQITLEQGIASTYAWYRQNLARVGASVA